MTLSALIHCLVRGLFADPDSHRLSSAPERFEPPVMHAPIVSSCRSLLPQPFSAVILEPPLIVDGSCNLRSIAHDMMFPALVHPDLKHLSYKLVPVQIYHTFSQHILSDILDACNFRTSVAYELASYGSLISLAFHISTSACTLACFSSACLSSQSLRTVTKSLSSKVAADSCTWRRSAPVAFAAAGGLAIGVTPSRHSASPFWCLPASRAWICAPRASRPRFCGAR
jgi:hypothetical protein